MNVFLHDKNVREYGPRKTFLLILLANIVKDHLTELIMETLIDNYFTRCNILHFLSFFS